MRPVFGSFCRMSYGNACYCACCEFLRVIVAAYFCVPWFEFAWMICYATSCLSYLLPSSILFFMRMYGLGSPLYGFPPVAPGC